MKKILAYFFIILTAYTFGQNSNYIEAGFLKPDRAPFSDGAFGTSSDSFNDILVIGAPNDNGGSHKSGAVYVYEWQNTAWVKTAKLIGPNNDSHDKFGNDVAIYENTIVIGSYRDDENGNSSGSVFVFEKINNEWVQTDKLIPSDNSIADFFGSSVDIYEDFIIVGTPSDDDKGKNSGSVYIFKHMNGTWSESVKLTASDGREDMAFGAHIALEDNTLVIGSRGNAYIFEYNTGNWEESKKLEFFSSPTSSYRTRIVDISHNTIVVGGFSPISILERKNGEWSDPIEITADGIERFDYFGESLDIENNTIIVGAFSNRWSGSAYIFERNTSNQWIETQKLISSNIDSYDFFGSSVVITQNSIVVGAKGEDSPDVNNPDVNDNPITLNSGAAYSFIHDSSLSSNEYSDTTFKIYPNPTNGFINITIDNNATIGDYNTSLINTQGQQIYSSNYFNKTIDLSNIRSGLYLLKIKNEFGTSSYKIIKK